MTDDMTTGSDRTIVREDLRELRSVILDRITQAELGVNRRQDDLSVQFREMNGRVAAVAQKVGEHEIMLRADQDRIKILGDRGHENASAIMAAQSRADHAYEIAERAVAGFDRIEGRLGTMEHDLVDRMRELLDEAVKTPPPAPADPKVITPEEIADARARRPITRYDVGLILAGCAALLGVLQFLGILHPLAHP